MRHVNSSVNDYRKAAHDLFTAAFFVLFSQENRIRFDYRRDKHYALSRNFPNFERKKERKHRMKVGDHVNIFRNGRWLDGQVYSQDKDSIVVYHPNCSAKNRFMYYFEKHGIFAWSNAEWTTDSPTLYCMKYAWQLPLCVGYEGLLFLFFCLLYALIMLYATVKECWLYIVDLPKKFRRMIKR